MSVKWVKREVSVSESDLARILGGTVTVDLKDSDGAHDVRRVLRALNPSAPVTVRGKSVIVPASFLPTVRAYLRGEIDPSAYRRHMPSDFYAWKGTIYERQ